MVFGFVQNVFIHNIINNGCVTLYIMQTEMLHNEK